MVSTKVYCVWPCLYVKGSVTKVSQRNPRVSLSTKSAELFSTGLQLLVKPVAIFGGGKLAGPHPVSILQSLAMAESSGRSIQQKSATTDKTRFMLGYARTIMYFFVQYETEIAEYIQTNPLTDTIISSV